MFIIAVAIKVLYGPQVHVGPVHDYSVEEGERIELTCSADGNPAPSQFEWYHSPSGKPKFFSCLLFISAIICEYD